MTANASRYTILATLIGSVAGAASAHQGPHLISHLHPHLGVEQLLAAAGLVLAAYGLSRLLRRG